MNIPEEEQVIMFGAGENDEDLKYKNLIIIGSTVIFLAGNLKRVLLISRSIFKAAAELSKTFAAVYLAFLTLEFFSKYLLILTALVLYLFYHSLLSFLTFYF
ncbi:unnamed protein product [Oikopleura dioica]|uniref:Uncharacterized protein n=1 Tax=Oikopleura dioica TaxID=34765 RepID=E4XFQ6_OIKDI|nr:unnamed protein product [Oikopleura dioica]